MLGILTWDLLHAKPTDSIRELWLFPDAVLRHIGHCYRCPLANNNVSWRISVILWQLGVTSCHQEQISLPFDLLQITVRPCCWSVTAIKMTEVARSFCTQYVTYVVSNSHMLQPCHAVAIMKMLIKPPPPGQTYCRLGPKSWLTNTSVTQTHKSALRTEIRNCKALIHMIIDQPWMCSESWIVCVVKQCIIVSSHIYINLHCTMRLGEKITFLWDKRTFWSSKAQSINDHFASCSRLILVAWIRFQYLF